MHLMLPLCRLSWPRRAVLSSRHHFAGYLAAFGWARTSGQPLQSRCSTSMDPAVERFVPSR